MELHQMAETIEITPKDDNKSTGVKIMNGGSYYEITVKGHIDKQWTDWFGDLSISHDESGFTILSGFIPDQSALHGVLAQIRDLSLVLISLTRREPSAQHPNVSLNGS
jgi:hypothetical protein